MLSVSVIAAATDEKAAELAEQSRRMSRRHPGRPSTPPPAEHTVRPSETEDDSTLLALTSPDGRFIGSVRTARERLQILIDHTGANELIVTTRIPAHTDRLQSYSLVAEAARAGAR
jgi:alkanesulfonate monooxygenase SsuD/methylene tetrahydromethanopterin reductase-like flavin-dependent oxidoreductase (luciferase family)